jgi:hypothetical protein
MSRWRVTIRTGPKVQKLSAGSLAEALETLETETRVAATTTRRGAVDLRYRTYEPHEQVATRAELRGPRTRAGFDVRGDGDVQAWTGRLRRRLLEPDAGETPYDTLRREIQSVRVDP